MEWSDGNSGTLGLHDDLLRIWDTKNESTRLFRHLKKTTQQAE
jgi:hypothetical protein